MRVNYCLLTREQLLVLNQKNTHYLTTIELHNLFSRNNHKATIRRNRRKMGCDDYRFLPRAHTRRYYFLKDQVIPRDECIKTNLKSDLKHKDPYFPSVRRFGELRVISKDFKISEMVHFFDGKYSRRQIYEYLSYNNCSYISEEPTKKKKKPTKKRKLTFKENENLILRSIPTKHLKLRDMERLLSYNHSIEKIGVKCHKLKLDFRYAMCEVRDWDIDDQITLRKLIKAKDSKTALKLFKDKYPVIRKIVKSRWFVKKKFVEKSIYKKQLNEYGYGIGDIVEYLDGKREKFIKAEVVGLFMNGKFNSHILDYISKIDGYYYDYDMEIKNPPFGAIVATPSVGDIKEPCQFRYFKENCLLKRVLPLKYVSRTSKIFVKNHV